MTIAILTFNQSVDELSLLMRLQFACAYPIQYIGPMKRLRFLGDSLICLREFPEDARHDAGYQLDKVQRGEQPDDFKPMPSIGKGVEEIRVRDDTGVYRVVYTARLVDAVYVLHAFQKRTQATAKRDIELAKKRFTELMRGAQ
jgi:phage-related protein